MILLLGCAARIRLDDTEADTADTEADTADTEADTEADTADTATDTEDTADTADTATDTEDTADTEACPPLGLAPASVALSYSGDRGADVVLSGCAAGLYASCDDWIIDPTVPEEVTGAPVTVRVNLSDAWSAGDRSGGCWIGPDVYLTVNAST